MEVGEQGDLGTSIVSDGYGYLKRRLAKRNKGSRLGRIGEEKLTSTLTRLWEI